MDGNKEVLIPAFFVDLALPIISKRFNLKNFIDIFIKEQLVFPA